MKDDRGFQIRLQENSHGRIAYEFLNFSVLSNNIAMAAKVGNFMQLNCYATSVTTIVLAKVIRGGEYVSNLLANLKQDLVERVKEYVF